MWLGFSFLFLMTTVFCRCVNVVATTTTPPTTTQPVALSKS